MWKRIFKKSDLTSVYKPITIGISGISHSCSPLYFCMAIGNFLGEYCGKRVALLEWNTDNDFKKIRNAHRIRDGNKNGLPNFFRFKKMDLFPETGIGEFLMVREMEYECIVINFGDDLSLIRPELSRCDHIYISVNLNPWKIGSFLEYLNIEEESAIRGRNYIYTFGDKDTEKQIERRYKIPLKKMPFMESPFLYDEKSFVFLKEIMNNLW